MKNDRWKSREWHGTTKNRWQQPVGSSGGQSPVDTWEHAKPEGKLNVVSAEYEVLNALVKKKENHVDQERQGKREKRS